MTGSRIAALLDQLDPTGVPDTVTEGLYEAAESLLAAGKLEKLAPDMARLLVDMADHLAATRNWVCANMGNPDDMDALLARFAALDEKAGGA